MRSDRVAGACACQEWTIVKAYQLPRRYIVESVLYALVGNQSRYALGNCPSSAFCTPDASSDLGARWRVELGGSVASVLPGSQLRHPTSTSVELLMATEHGDKGLRSSPMPFDLNPHAYDAIAVLFDPQAVVLVDFVGNVSVFWPDLQVRKECSFLAGWLDGSVPPTSGHDGTCLQSLSLQEQADILRHDAFYDPPGRDPATLATDPRFIPMGSTDVLYSSTGAWPQVPIEWTPCTAPLADDAFPVLLDGFLQYSFLTGNPTCGPQRPGLAVGTSTEGCQVSANVLVDRVFGTVAMVPTATQGPCTTPPSPLPPPY